MQTTWYKYEGDTEWRTVSISGAISGDVDEGTPTTQIPNVATKVTDLEIGTGVTSIGDVAFMDCVMTSITIPDSITSIGEGAFSGSWRLTSVTFEGKDRANVQGMSNYPFGFDQANDNGVTIHCTDGDLTVSYNS